MYIVVIRDDNDKLLSTTFTDDIEAAKEIASHFEHTRIMKAPENYKIQVADFDGNKFIGEYDFVFSKTYYN